MRKKQRLVLVVMGACLLPASAWAQQSVRWEPTLDSAKRRAAQTGRLVLIHFWADWCPACRKMEAEVFSQPQVAAALQADFVPVKVNADYFPATRRQYGVTALPTDVIVTPQGQQVEQFQGSAVAVKYMERLGQVAARTRQRGGAPIHAQIPAGPAALAANAPGQPQGEIARHPSAMRGYSDARYGAPAMAGQTAPLASIRGPSSGAAAPALPLEYSASQAAPSQPSPGNPPLGLDGYCPIQLSERKDVWTMGDRRWGAIHRGRTYLFAGPEQQRRFLSAPDRYAPILSGNDVVLAAEERQTVPGHRKHGLFFGERVFLFASEASLAEFSKRPDYYAKWALGAMRSETNQEYGAAAQSPEQRY